MRLYSKKIPAKEAARDFAARVWSHIPAADLRERVSDDVKKSRYSHQEWYRASDRNSTLLSQKLKEPQSLLFFCGAIYVSTFNDPQEAFSQSQQCFLYDVPEQNDLNDWKKIDVLMAPPGLKEIIFDETKTKAQYISEGFYEVSLGTAPQRVQSLSHNFQGKRKQYGLKHNVSATIHAAMGDTLIKMATSISDSNTNLSVWEKGMLVVLLSRTKYAKDSIFVGSKTDTLAAFRNIITLKTQWSDYIEDILELVTINSNEGHGRNRMLTPENYPFRICDIALPQCQSGFVYMLVSLRQRNFTYIGTTNCIRLRLQQHNSGNGAVDTAPVYLRPFALFAYVCGFGGGRRDLRYHIENKWKDKRDELAQSGVTDVCEWAICANTVINHVSNDFRTTAAESLSLVLLFKS